MEIYQPVKYLLGSKKCAVHCLDILKFMRQIIPEKAVPDFAVRRNCYFLHRDFTRSFLSDEELEQLNGYKSLKKQMEWLAGRFVVKNMVRETLYTEGQVGIGLDQIQISHRTQGAPFLENYPHLHISISHSGDYAAAALCRTETSPLPEEDRKTLPLPEEGWNTSTPSDIGLDIEKIGKLPDHYFMKTAFTEREIQNITLTPQEVFRCWTVKEAFLKYIGKGFNESLHSVEILNNKLLYHGRPVDVTVHSFVFCSCYALSLVE